MSRQRTERGMSSERFARLEMALQQAVEHVKGERKDLRATVLPVSPKPMTRTEVTAIREQLSASQAVFARLLNVSVKTVQAWEQGRRTPSDAALKLLTIARINPQALYL